MLLVETLADAHALRTFAFLVFFKHTSISCPAGLSFCSSMSFRWRFLDSSLAQKTKCIHNSQQKVLWSASWVESPNPTYTNEAFSSSLTAFARAPLLLMTFPKKRYLAASFSWFFKCFVMPFTAMPFKYRRRVHNPKWFYFWRLRFSDHGWKRWLARDCYMERYCFLLPRWYT